MNRILRSVIQVSSQPPADEALNNWNRLLEYNLDFPSEELHKIYRYLKDFYSQMSASPDFSLVLEYFEKLDDIETVDQLNEIKSAQWYIQTNYISIVRGVQEQQQIKNFALLCRDAQIIAEHGRNFDKPVNGKKILRGVNDAVNFVFDNLHEFTRVEGGEKLEGTISDDADEVIDEYELIEKTNKYMDRNLFGLEPIDSVCRGHRRGEYWIHCGFAGELKSTLAINYAYNNIMVYKKNIFYAILEMPYKQLRRQFYALHSSNGKFVTAWHREDGYVGLDYRQIRDGELSKKDKERFKIVARDFQKSAEGRLFIWRPNDEININEIRRKAEIFHNKCGCDGIIIDHLGLVLPNRRFSDYVISLNSVIREGRLMALNFARGRGVPVLGLFQLNRQGKLKADKNDGRYDFAAISYANECCLEGTLVQTSRGLIPIEQIQPLQDKVWSLSGWKLVKDKFQNGIKNTLKITTDRGASINVTDSHRIRVIKNNQIQWIEVKDLKEGDYVPLLKDINIKFLVTRIKKLEKSVQGMVWDLEVDGDHEYMTNGFLSHNCEKSADVITYTYLNELLRNEGKFYFGNLKNRDNAVFDRFVGKIIWQTKRMRAIESGLLDSSDYLTTGKLLELQNRLANDENRLTTEELLAI